MRFIFVLILTVLMFPQLSFASDYNAEKKKIDQLLTYISESDVIFIRNEKEYNSARAARHIRYKMTFARGKIKTADQFITHLCSQSYSTGTPYYVTLKDGTKMTSAKWLRAQLATLESYQSAGLLHPSYE